MIIPFKKGKEISYIFSVHSNEDRRIVGVSEDQDRKYCILELQSITELREVLDPIQAFMENNHFQKEQTYIPITDVVKK